MCEWKPDFDALNKRVNGIETRMTQVEHDVGKMRTETADGYEHIDTGYVRRALTPEEAAVLAAKRLGAREERIERLRQMIQEELARGSAPATNDATIASTALARIRAAKYQTQLDRLLSSGTTNTVDVVITPQTP